MIINFEDFTYELTDDEKKLILPILECFNLYTGRRIVVNVITDFLNDKHGIIVAEIRVKKILSLIRRIPIQWNGQILIATSAGYFWSSDKIDITNYIDSLDARIKGIQALRDQANNFLNKP